ncbi:hypothetical protein RSSM_05778 [Rhodopirellula sallentina SM41]|uniref:Uncharacterized protein n=1 Tax=Rhodopirellula sallentina SM41 TaxID=1263870 RepID=M5TUF4_9BACT|nr:hypothetical protein RSSM_05778 [Rhodopirellula sallentina SM41]
MDRKFRTSGTLQIAKIGFHAAAEKFDHGASEQTALNPLGWTNPIPYPGVWVKARGRFLRSTRRRFLVADWQRFDFAAAFVSSPLCKGPLQ